MMSDEQVRNFLASRGEEELYDAYLLLKAALPDLDETDRAATQATIDEILNPQPPVDAEDVEAWLS